MPRIEVVSEDVNPSDDESSSNETDLTADPFPDSSDDYDQTPQAYDPDDDPTEDYMERKYDSDNESDPVDTPDPPDPPPPISRELRGLQALLEPINPKYTKPNIVNDGPRTRSGRAVVSSQSSSSNPNNYYPADMHEALTQRMNEYVNAAIEYVERRSSLVSATSITRLVK